MTGELTKGIVLFLHTCLIGGWIPEFVRIALSGCLKVAVLKGLVNTIISKAKGLRVQTTDIVLGEPGVGKGQAFQ